MNLLLSNKPGRSAPPPPLEFHSFIPQIILALSILLGADPTSTWSQNFSIPWNQVTSGTKSSSNLQFVVSGTIGQATFGAQLNSSRFTLTTGFWSLIEAVQTPGAPHLNVIVIEPTTAILSWTEPNNAFRLQQSVALSTPDWVDVSESATVTGNLNQVQVKFQGNTRFFRLFHP